MVGKVIWHVTMSLDGFIAGPDDAMEWAFAYDEPDATADAVRRTTGAILGGRHWFDVAERKYQGRRGIYGGKWHGPVFVLTHDPPVPSPDAGVRFLTSGVPEAVATSLAAAGGKNLEIFGGRLARQCLAAALIDEIVVHVAPVLLGGGTRLYGAEPASTVRLERLEASHGRELTHLRFHVAK